MEPELWPRVGAIATQSTSPNALPNREKILVTDNFGVGERDANGVRPVVPQNVVRREM
jgi:hypothetical protein